MILELRFLLFFYRFAFVTGQINKTNQLLIAKFNHCYENRKCTTKHSKNQQKYDCSFFLFSRDTHLQKKNEE